MERWDNGRDNGSVYASQPAICQSHHRVYDRTNVHLGLAYIVHSVDYVQCPRNYCDGVTLNQCLINNNNNKIRQ